MDFGAIRIWKNVLSESFKLDKGTFLICSIIPLSYVEVIGNVSLIVVDYKDIEKHTKFASQGCEYLIDIEFAKWLNKYKVATHDDQTLSLPIGIEYRKLVIGEASNFINFNYYYNNRVKAKKELVKDKEEPVQAIKLGSKKVNNQSTYIMCEEIETQNVDVSQAVEFLDSWFEKYKAFCFKIRLLEKPNKIEKKVKAVVAKVKNGNKLIHTDLLTYLDCVNAMVNEWTDVPDRYTDTKERHTATRVLTMASPENILKAIPYFVEHYPSWAKAGYESTNIFMLSFHINICLKKLNASNKRELNKGFDDDRL